MRKKRFIYIGGWIVIWVVVWVVFKDFLPAHAHFEYFGLVSPLLLLVLPFYGSELTADAYPLVVIPGVLFWTVFVVVFFITRRKAV